MQKEKTTREEALEKIKKLEVKGYEEITPLVRVKSDYPAQDSSFIWYRIKDIEDLRLLEEAYPNLWVGEIEDEIPDVVCVEVAAYDGEGYSVWSLGRMIQESLFFVNQFAETDLKTAIKPYHEQKAPGFIKEQIFREKEREYLKQDADSYLHEFLNTEDAPDKLLDVLVEEFEKRCNTEIGDLYTWEEIISRYEPIIREYIEKNKEVNSYAN